MYRLQKHSRIQRPIVCLVTHIQLLYNAKYKCAVVYYTIPGLFIHNIIEQVCVCLCVCVFCLKKSMPLAQPVQNLAKPGKGLVLPILPNEVSSNEVCQMRFRQNIKKTSFVKNVKTKFRQKCKKRVIFACNAMITILQFFWQTKNVL